jgi:tetratricopeptide (TPR) repeat protein
MNRRETLNTLERLCVAFGVTVLLAACGQQQEAGEYVEEVAVEEIPTTTTSESALAHFEQGQALFDVGRAVPALDHFRLAIEQDPTFVRGYIGIANTVFSPEEARAAIGQAAANLEGASDGERILVEIVQAGQDNNTDRQLELANTLVQQYPTSPRAHVVLAGVQAARLAVDEARASTARAVELDPQMVGAHAGLFFSTMFQEPYDFDAAEKHALRVVELDPDNPMGYSFRGDVRRALVDYEGARELYTTALDKDPALGLAALKRGIVNTFLGNYDEARADYQLAADVDKGTNKITNANFSAFVHVYEGDPKAAIGELEKIDAEYADLDIPADQMRSVRQFTLSNAATIALYNELIPEAKTAVRNLTALMRENAEATGDVEFTRQQEAAMRIWEGRLAARSGDFETAGTKAEESKALLEGDANPRKLEPYHQVHGLVALRQGNAEQAIAHYEQGNLQNPFIKYHLGLAHEAAGNTDKAREIFQEVADYQFVSAGTALVRPAAIAKLQ